MFETSPPIPAAAEKQILVPSTPENCQDEFNNLEEIQRLELRSQVIELVRANLYFKEIDTTMVRRLAGLLIRNDNPEDAWELFSNLETTTRTQQEALSIPIEDFITLHEEVHVFIESSESDIIQNTESLITSTNGKLGKIAWNDRYQKNQGNTRRSLEVMRNNGVVIELPSEYIEILHKEKELLMAGDRCPILEHIKNHKIFTINGFKGSKASLTTHDLFDHFWTYDLLEKEGLFQKYADFLQKIGNPQETDIFKREAELIASTAFGTRLYKVSEPGFEPLFTLQQVARVLRKSLENLPDSNQGAALDLLSSIEPRSYEGKSLAFVISNMAIELMEQRRKHGPIKILDEEFRPVGVLKILDPEYLSLMIESHHLLVDPQNKAENVLVKISVIVEEYLHTLANNETTSPLVITLDTINDFRLENSFLPPSRISWLQQNSGFASTKSYLC